MAYNDNEYLWPQEHTAYDLVAYQDSVSFSGYESYDHDTYDAYTVSAFQEPEFVDDYNHSLDYNHNYFSSGINYLAYNYAAPKLIEYKPVSCDTGYVSYHTQYSISYSEMDLKFNETEFEEYDPTPYGGGYDIVSVYGKPLPPSDQTCYPRSTPKSAEPKSKPVVNPIPLVNSIPEPQQEPRSKPQPEPVHVPVLMPPDSLVPVTTTEPLVDSEPESEPEPVHVPVTTVEPSESKEIIETERDECSYCDYGFDYPWPEYDHGYGIGVGYDYGYGKQVVQVPPCEYNPEVVELCENIFGSWPCLAKIRKQQMDLNNNPGATCPQNGHHNPWEECATYIFGRPFTSYHR